MVLELYYDNNRSYIGLDWMYPNSLNMCANDTFLTPTSWIWPPSPNWDFATVALPNHAATVATLTGSRRRRRPAPRYAIFPPPSVPPLLLAAHNRPTRPPSHRRPALLHRPHAAPLLPWCFPNEDD